jgi:cardiolipin synthase A/B
MKSHAVWESERIFHRAHDFYAAVHEDVTRAKSGIDLEAYIFDDDELGHRVMEALKSAVQRKVAVRVIVDGLGASEWAARFIPDLLKAGVETRVFRPVPWLFLRLASNRVPPLWRMVRLFTFFNRRNHRKVWIVDGRIAYAGSLNISAHHLEKTEGGDGWRDTGVRVEGREVAELAWGFEKAWAASWRFGGGRRFFKGRLSALKPAALSGLVRLNDRAKARRWLFRNLLKRIVSAKSRVWITNPYFIPARSLVRELCQAAQRGVDVRILVPRRPDVRFIHLATAAFFEPLLRTGVRIYEYLPNVLHAKLLQIDDWATVGSSNLNNRSLLHDLEVDLVITHPESRMSLEEQFLKDLEQSEEVTSDSLRKRSRLGAFAGRVLLLFRYWM